MYEYHNQNPLELLTDDCTIRAISVAENKTWDETYDNLSNLAQYHGKLLNDSDFIVAYLDSKYARIPIDNVRVGDIANKYSDNVLLITMPGHITVSKYGTIYDIFDCRDYYIEYAWIVK